MTTNRESFVQGCKDACAAQRKVIANLMPQLWDHDTDAVVSDQLRTDVEANIWMALFGTEESIERRADQWFAQHPEVDPDAEVTE